MSDLSEISKNENGEGSMSRNAIKYLAMAAMFCNHFAYIFLKEGSTGQVRLFQCQHEGNL